MKFLMCDPDSGWKYGFPKPIPQDIVKANQDDFHAWLVTEGYCPQAITRWVESRLGYLPVRFWEHEATGRLEGWYPTDFGDCIIISGDIYEDTQNRWEDGEFMRTSRIDRKYLNKLKKGAIIPTLNSIYVLGEPFEGWIESMLESSKNEPTFKEYNIGESKNEDN